MTNILPAKRYLRYQKYSPTMLAWNGHIVPLPGKQSFILLAPSLLSLPQPGPEHLMSPQSLFYSQWLFRFTCVCATLLLAVSQFISLSSFEWLSWLSGRVERLYCQAQAHHSTQ